MPVFLSAFRFPEVLKALLVFLTIIFSDDFDVFLFHFFRQIELSLFEARNLENIQCFKQNSQIYSDPF